MSKGKHDVDAYFAAVPLRALSDPQLTDRDVRILAVLAAFDRMSTVTKKGQGAWAGHRTMAALVGDGANESNFSVSVTKLVSAGYLGEGRMENDGRRRVYRVIYDDRDGLFFGKVSDAEVVRPTAKNQGEIVCPGSQDTLPDQSLSSGNVVKFPAQYREDIPLSGRYSAEAGIHLAETSRAEAREILRKGGNAVTAYLHDIEVRMKSGLESDQRQQSCDVVRALKEEGLVVELRDWADKLERKLRADWSAQVCREPLESASRLRRGLSKLPEDPIAQIFALQDAIDFKKPIDAEAWIFRLAEIAREASREDVRDAADQVRQYLETTLRQSAP